MPNNKKIMLEHWIRYTTDKLFEKEYYFDSLEYQGNTLTITLHESGNNSTVVHVTFQDSVQGFRNTNESYAYLTLDTLTDLYGADFYVKRTLFRVFHSRYLHSFGKHKSLFHFAIVPIDWFIDVIASKEPTITLIERKQ